MDKKIKLEEEKGREGRRSEGNGRRGERKGERGKKGRGKGEGKWEVEANQFEKWEGGEGNQVSGTLWQMGSLSNFENWQFL